MDDDDDDDDDDDFNSSDIQCLFVDVVLLGQKPWSPGKDAQWNIKKFTKQWWQNFRGKTQTASIR